MNRYEQVINKADLTKNVSREIFKDKKTYPGYKVDLHDPAATLKVELRNEAAMTVTQLLVKKPKVKSFQRKWGKLTEGE